MEAVIFLLVLALVGWMIFVQVAARQQLDTMVGVSEQEAAQLTMRYFGVMWTQVQGDGHLNYRPKLRAHAPTISITFQPNGTTQCAVAIWVSQYQTRYGIMGHAQLMWRKKRGLVSRLASATGPAPLTRGASTP